MRPEAKVIAKHVKYEFSMIDYCFGRLKSDAASIWEQNIREESFLLHVRVLRDFFDGKSNYQDDVQAQDFFDDPAEWAVDLAAMCPCISGHKDDLNKRLAHLSYERSGLNIDWDFDELNEEILSVKQLFLQSLPADKREWFAT